MGMHINITHEKFPQQGEYLGKEVNVCFHYDTRHIIKGTIVRYDIEDPHVTIIELDDGRRVLGVECQYEIIDD